MKKLGLAIFLGMLGCSGGMAIADPGGGPSVTVVNPPANPVKTSSVDDPGRTPYQVTHKFVVGECLSNLLGCSFSPPPVPAGKRLVVQHIAVDALTASGVAFVNVAAWDTSALRVLASFNVPVFAAPAGGTANADQTVLFYVDAGSSFYGIIDVAAGTLSGVVPGSLNITGYLVDCTISPCAPIAP